jgi:flagellar biosynthesis/type III secretory pathway protein FliH
VTRRDDVRPFLPFAAQPTRALGDALPAIATPEVTSPWLPRPAILLPAVPDAPAIDLEAITAEARERGRAEGREETAALRAQLGEVIEALVAVRAAIVAPAADTIAEVCGAVIEAWLDATDRQTLFAPVVRAWLAASAEPATVRANPADVGALVALIGDAPLAIVGDPGLAAGAIAIRSAALEVSHDWRARLPELRTAIEAALGSQAPAIGPTTGGAA